MGWHKAGGDDVRMAEEAEGARSAGPAEEEGRGGSPAWDRAGTRRWGAWARGGSAARGRRGERGGGWGRESRAGGDGAPGLLGRSRSDLSTQLFKSANYMATMLV